MHLVIMGCGRVGSLLAHRLDEAGHSVAVVDQDPGAFRRLGDEFGGVTVKGIGFDRETLERAGIQKAHGFAAVSSGDNTNILAARVARETYGVEHVVARIYDPRRAEVYQRLGIPTVATVSWTAGQILRGLLPQGTLEEYRDPSGSVILSEMVVDDSWFGDRVLDIEQLTGARVAFITRLGIGMVPGRDTMLQTGDVVHVLCSAGQRDEIADALGAPRSLAEERAQP
ncbi:MAG: potassium channel family protein [Actinomycetota bacterium]